MTILIAHVGRDRALLLSDSLAVSDGRRHLLGKVTILPYVCGAFAGRGDAGLVLATALVLQGEALDYDQVRARLPRIASEMAVARAGHADRFQLLVIGWSRSSERAAGFLVEREGAGPITGQDVFGEFAAPWSENLGKAELPDVVDEATALRTARAIVDDLGDGDCPAAPPFVLANCTAAGVSARVIP